MNRNLCHLLEDTTRCNLIRNLLHKLQMSILSGMNTTEPDIGIGVPAVYDVAQENEWWDGYLHSERI